MSSSLTGFLDESSHLNLNNVTSNEKRTVLPSPSASFYRQANAISYTNDLPDNFNLSLSPQGSESKFPEKCIGRASIPPSITRYLPRRKSNIKFPSLLPSSQGSNVVPDPLLILQRRQKSLQVNTQLLLDAQSKGLEGGFGNEVESTSDGDSQASTIKSLETTNSSRVIPVRQPKKKQVRLHDARTGLVKILDELIEIKYEEQAILKQKISTREDAVKTANYWETKLLKVKEQLDSPRVNQSQSLWGEVDGKNEFLDLMALKKEEKAIEIKIDQLEKSLAGLKAKHASLKERISEGVNRQEARLSSYRGTLRNTEYEIEEFLKHPPVQDSTVVGEKPGLNALPLNKRSLGNAKELWNNEISKISLQIKDVESEKSALEEGMLMWKDCVRLITKFEGDLRKMLKSGDVEDEDSLRQQIKKMDLVIIKLEEHLYKSEDCGWNLLICAIGAELEAFLEGSDILKRVFKTQRENFVHKARESLQSNVDGNDCSLHDVDEENTRQSLERALNEVDCTRE